MSKTLDQRRSEIEATLRRAGYDVDSWRSEAERHYRENPRPTPASRQLPNYTKGRKMLRAGYSEYRPHPRHGTLIPRCLARAAHGDQCGSFACKDAYHCPRHGGRRTGRTYRGSDHHWFHNAGEGREARRRRSEASKERRTLRRIINELKD